jgi:hypothetical protein
MHLLAIHPMLKDHKAPRYRVVVLCARTTVPNHIPISNRKSCKMYENLSFLRKNELSNE